MNDIFAFFSRILYYYSLIYYNSNQDHHNNNHIIIIFQKFTYSALKLNNTYKIVYYTAIIKAFRFMII